MPAALTELTELVTGLGMLSAADPEEAVSHRPPELVNVDDDRWARLVTAVTGRTHAATVHAAWNNGRAFLRADDGLRGRAPLRVEWRGPKRTPGYDLLPADLRVDHVFLVSCKYMSRILFNVAPAHLFDRALAVRDAAVRTDWFVEVAPAAYDDFYAAVRRQLGAGLPRSRFELTAEDRRAIQEAAGGRWPTELEGPATEFSRVVAEASAARWRAVLGRAAEREEMLWRLLRLQAAPYFVLGTSPGATLRLRIATPWDWRQRYRLLALEVAARAAAQPTVGWSARVRDREEDREVTVEGHVEVRWSHGRFSGHPEAKVYLDSPHHRVPGYVPLG